MRYFEDYKEGDKVGLTVVRDGKEKKLTIELGESQGHDAKSFRFTFDGDTDDFQFPGGLHKAMKEIEIHLDEDDLHDDIEFLHRDRKDDLNEIREEMEELRKELKKLKEDSK